MAYKEQVKWNPWHGCHKCSAGCQNCFVFGMDKRYGRDTETVKLNRSQIDLPVKYDVVGWKYPAGTLFATCFSSDFFLEDADEWRPRVWNIIKTRSDCDFFIITKRVERIKECFPEDWGDGYSNVCIAVTCENQAMADKRLPIYLNIPMRNKAIICAPLLTPLDLTPYLTDEISKVSVGGESGPNARPCDYKWVLDIREQCVKHNKGFEFRQTGANLIIDNAIYRIPKQNQKSAAASVGIDWFPDTDQKFFGNTIREANNY